MKYLILIYGNPASREFWSRVTGSERTDALESYASLNRDLEASGESIVHESLADPSQTLRVWVRAGQTLTTDGSYVEASEHLSGFYLVDCPNIERAVLQAARIPEAAYGLVEVRPIRDISQYGV